MAEKQPHSGACTSNTMQMLRASAFLVTCEVNLISN